MISRPTGGKKCRLKKVCRNFGNSFFSFKTESFLPSNGEFMYVVLFSCFFLLTQVEKKKKL